MDLNSLNIIGGHTVILVFTNGLRIVDVADGEPFVITVPLIFIHAGSNAENIIVIRVAFHVGSHQAHTVHNDVNELHIGVVFGIVSLQRRLEHIVAHIVDTDMFAAGRHYFSAVDGDVVSDSRIGSKLLATAIVAVQFPADKDVEVSRAGGSRHVITKRLSALYRCIPIVLPPEVITRLITEVDYFNVLRIGCLQPNVMNIFTIVGLPGQLAGYKRGGSSLCLNIQAGNIRGVPVIPDSPGPCVGIKVIHITETFGFTVLKCQGDSLNVCIKIHAFRSQYPGKVCPVNSIIEPGSPAPIRVCPRRERSNGQQGEDHT